MTIISVAFLIVLASLGGSQAIRCACERDPSCSDVGDVCEVAADGACFASLFKDGKSGKIIRNLRCLEPAILVPKGRPLICEYSRKNAHKYVSACCSGSDLCNANLHLVLNITEEESPDDGFYGLYSTDVLLPAVLSTVLLIGLIVLVILYLVLVRSRRLSKRPAINGDGVTSAEDSGPCSFCCMRGNLLTGSDDGYRQVEVRSHNESSSSTIQAQGGTAGITVVTGSELNDYLTSSYSGSGSGLPLLVQRSVARQVPNIIR